MDGLKPAVTPVGSPETLKPTVPVNPLSAPTEMLAVALPLGVDDTVAGEESEKPEMFKVTEAVWVKLPLVPVTVNGKLPAVAPLAVNVKVDEPEVVTVLGLNPAVTPVGNPETLKPTVPVKPLSAPTVMLAVVLPVDAADTDAGADSEKFAVFVTFKVTDAVCVWLPLVPVTVKG